MKRQPSGWEKIIANETDKGLVFKIYKHIIKLNIRKTNNPMKKTGRRPKQTFLQRRHADGQQTHEKMLNTAHYQQNANQDNVILCSVGGDVNWYSHYGNRQGGCSSKK